MRELLNGVYDLHIHTSPDVVPRKYSDLELARRLAERGMAGCASSATILTLRPGPAC
mgnify:CR=1 FL=1